MRYAILDGGNKVTNVIEGDPASITEIYPTAVAASGSAGVGSTYDPVAKTFSDPPVMTARVINVVKFLERIPAAKLVAINASTDVNVQALVTELLASVDVELDSSDLVNGLNYCVSLGLLTSADVTAALA